MRSIAAWIIAFVFWMVIFAFAANVSVVRAFDQPSCAEDVVLVQESGVWVCGPAFDDQPILVIGTYPECDSPDYLVGTGDFAPDASGSYVWDAFECGYAPLEQDLTNIAAPLTVLPDTAVSRGDGR